MTEFGIIAYLRSIAGRCERMALIVGHEAAKKELRAVSADLIEKAAVLENTFRVAASDKISSTKA